MNHSQLKKRLSPYLEGDLEPDERARIDLHLRDCEACAEHLHELRATVALVRSLGSPEPPPRLAADVMARIRDGEGRVTWVRRLWAALSSPALSAPLAAGAVVAVALALLPAMPVRSPDRVAPPLVARTEAQPAATAPIPRAAARPVALATRRPEPAAAPVEIAAAEPVAMDVEIPSPARPNQAGIPVVESASARSGAPVTRRTAAFAGASMDRGLTRLDRDLDRIMARPEWFLEELMPLPNAYRDSWVDGLAQRARQVNRSAEIADRVRATNHPLAEMVAGRFADDIRAEAGLEP